MRVEWAILSRYAEGSAGVATIVGAGIDTFYSAEFPVPIQAALTVQLRGHPEELGETHDISLRIVDANIELVGEAASLTFEAEPNPHLETGWEAGVLSMSESKPSFRATLPTTYGRMRPACTPVGCASTRSPSASSAARRVRPVCRWWKRLPVAAAC